MQQRGVEKLVAVVSHCSERDKLLEAIHAFQRTKAYKCPTAKVFALHVILDLYNEDSSDKANLTRIATNLEAASHELLYLSKRLKSLA